MGVFEAVEDVGGLWRIVLAGGGITVPLYARSKEGAEVWIDVINEACEAKGIFKDKVKTEQGMNLQVMRRQHRDLEIELLKKALWDANGNQSMAAARLGIKRSTLLSTLKRENGK